MHPSSAIATAGLEDESFRQPPAGSGAKRRGTIRDEHAMAVCEGMIDIAAALFNVSSKELRKPGRTSQDVSRVRQIAMYVAHVILQLNMTDIGRGFGRDRTTVVHACHLVEDLRDDKDFDRVVAITERVALATFCNRGTF